MDMKKWQTYTAIGLSALVVVYFIYAFFSSLPSQSLVDQTAQPSVLPPVPSSLFSSSSTLNKTLNGLNVPSGVPVVVDPTTVGRSNVWRNY